MASRDSYLKFAKTLCANDLGLMESIMSIYQRTFMLEDAAQSMQTAASTAPSPTSTPASESTVPDIVLNTSKLTPDSANVIAKKLIDLANQEETLSQSKKELQNLSGAAYNGG